MLKLERTCDRCGAVVEKIDYKNKLENILTPTISFFDGKEDTNYDICDSCACQFLDWMKNAAITVKQEVTPREELKKALEKHGKQSRWSDEALAIARAHNESVERDLSLSERQELPVAVPKIDKSKIKIKAGTHTYHRWTEEEDDFILHHSAGMSINDLACKFGVTKKAMSARRYNLLNGKVSSHD